MDFSPDLNMYSAFTKVPFISYYDGSSISVRIIYKEHTKGQELILFMFDNEFSNPFVSDFYNWISNYHYTASICSEVRHVYKSEIKFEHIFKAFGIHAPDDEFLGFVRSDIMLSYMKKNSNSYNLLLNPNFKSFNYDELLCKRENYRRQGR